MRTQVVLTRLALAALMALATGWFGWPAPAVVGALVGALAGAGAPLFRPAREAAVAALLGWGALLAWALLGGRAAAVAGMLGSLAGVRGPNAGLVVAALALLTLALGALLAWSAATFVAGLLGLRIRARAASAPGRVTLSATHPTAAPTP